MPSIFIILVGILISTLLLSIVLYWQKTKPFFMLIGKLGIRLCLAALGLFLLNWAGQYFDFKLAINPVTVSAVAVLGVPGVITLAILKYIV